MHFLNFQFDILFTKKVLRFKKINAINREIEVGNVGIGKNQISDTCPFFLRSCVEKSFNSEGSALPERVEFPPTKKTTHLSFLVLVLPGTALALLQDGVSSSM